MSGIIDEHEVSTTEVESLVEESPLLEDEAEGPYRYYESSPGRDDEETRRIVRSALKLLLEPEDPKK